MDSGSDDAFMKDAVKKSKTIPDNDPRDEAAFAKERERVAKLVAEGGAEGGVLRANGLVDDAILDTWSRVIREEGWSVEKAMRMAAGVGDQKGLTEVGMVLRTDNSLWREWWAQDFPECEYDLGYIVRGLPEWITNQTIDSGPNNNLDIAAQYADVPWRRLYVWFVFFKRRCAKLALAAAKQTALDWKARKEADVLVDQDVPRGALQKIYLPEYVLQGTKRNALLVDEMVLVRTTQPIFGDTIHQMVNQQKDTLAQIVFHRDRDLFEYNPIWLVWHLMQTVVDVDPEDGTLSPTWIEEAQDWLADARPANQKKDGKTGNPLTYPFFKEPLDFGKMMLAFIARYNLDATRPLTEEEHARLALNNEDATTYEEYLDTMEDDFESRHPRPERVNQVLTADHMEVVSTRELDNLPFAPTRRREDSANAPQILFVGEGIIGAHGGLTAKTTTTTTPPHLCIGCNTNEAVHRCKQCKVAAYCGKDCQTAHWTDLHKYECTGDPYNAALIEGGVKRDREESPSGDDDPRTARNPWMELSPDMLRTIALKVSDYSAFIALTRSSKKFRERVASMGLFRFILENRFQIYRNYTSEQVVDVSRFAAEILAQQMIDHPNREYVLLHKSGKGSILIGGEYPVNLVFDGGADVKYSDHRTLQMFSYEKGESPEYHEKLVSVIGFNDWYSAMNTKRSAFLARLLEALWRLDGYRWRLPVSESQFPREWHEFACRFLYRGDNEVLYIDPEGTMAWDGEWSDEGDTPDEAE